MATVPVSGTNIRLLSGIPFSNDYKHTRWFDNLTDQTNYFQAKTVVHQMTDATFQRIEGFNFIKVDLSIDQLWGTNYLMFQNKDYNNKWFYGFVTKLEYKQRNTTYVHFEIDVFQTWKFDMNFKPSYVLREHRPLWNADGTPVVNTVDEGLNYGADYETVNIDTWKPYGDLYFLVIVSKSIMHGSTQGDITPTVNALPQPLSYYVHPFRLDGSYPTVHNNNQDVALSSLTDLLSALYKETNAVNNIVSLYVTDYIGDDSLSYDGTTLTMDSITYSAENINDGTNSFVTMYLNKLPNYSTSTVDLGSKYSNYKTVTESKLLMYPYTVTILDDFKGNRTVVKNEMINNTNLNLVAKGSLGTSNKTSYHVKDYLQMTNISSTYVDEVSQEHALINNNPSDIPILSDYLSAYLQGNKNTIQNQKSTAVWDGVFNAVGSTIGGVASAVKGNVAGVAQSVTSVAKGTGDTVLKIHSINAKLKDIGNIPPQIVKMGNNTEFDYGNGYKGVFIIKKQIRDEYITKLENFFNMYGYMLNEVKVPNFHTRQNWNYVQTISCVITGNFNNEDLNELKSIFDNGITLWHTDDIGNYSLSNGVI